ncbi:hypothetical protein CRG98_027354 [Punica granatum]|uniref:DUF7745 domain-containing protein n=1 Tax=Punica granatum TaxID=22663 RepID=A0A2I0J980_PUNGR|nr:hypothetical protein CRG98_027354 [Punica granatum]
MDRLHPCFRLDVIVTPAADITRLWNTFRPVDRAFLRLIIGDLPLLADSPIDWTLLRTAISFWDTQQAVFSFQGTELALTVEEYATLIQRPMPTRDIVVPNQFAKIQSRLAILLGLRDEEIRHELRYGWEHSVRTAWLIDFIHIRSLNAKGESYQHDACHGFLLLIFGTILFPYSSNLIDGVLAQVILQVVGGHSYVEAVLAETIRSIEPPRSSLLQPCRVCSSVRVYFYASQVRRATSLVPLATLPGLLTNASLLLSFASSPNHLARAFCNLAGSAHSCEFTFMLRKFAEPPRSWFLQPCRVCSPVLRKFAEPPRSFFLQPCRVCSPVRVYFYASQVRRATSLELLATLPGLLTRVSLLLCFASSPSHLARDSCNLAGFAHPCEFTLMLRKFAEPPRSCFLQPCRVCSPVRVYFYASQVRRATSLALLATLLGPLTRMSLLLPCELTFMLRMFARSTDPYVLQNLG